MCDVRREAYDLPADAELIVGDVKRTFTCEGLKYGYYADIDNGCRVFHVCNPVTLADGNTEMQQFSFMCGNQTVFNQFSMTCADEKEAIPCEMSRDFFYLNDRFGQEKEFFHTDADLTQYLNIVNQFGARSGKK
ncbi:cuticular protein-like protein [Leptotrombidium deliense]|uniref:Cuticular protein-like protein n=1 Tax=Leptotrombidium deliense TaxID=299467 RepID=A0A443SVT8_9ACAR|nr:cuticular protein-like protein [Leptotrombidium deliense]